MAKQVFLNPATATAPLRLWLEQNCLTTPEVISLSKDIGDVVWENACRINNGAPFERSIEAPLKPGRCSKRNGRKLRDNRGPLMPDRDGPSLGIAGVMLQETLNLARGHAQGDEHLAKLLRRQNPLTATWSVKDNDIDHYDPIRHNNQHINLIRTHLGITKLLTRSGICALATWFGTGQGLVLGEGGLWLTTDTWSRFNERTRTIVQWGVFRYEPYCEQMLFRCAGF